MEEKKQTIFKLSDLVEINVALSFLGSKEELFCAFDVAKNLKILKPHVKYFNEEQTKLLDKHVLRNEDGSYQCEKDKDGKDTSTFLLGHNQFPYNKALDALGNKDIKGIEFHQIVKSDLKEKGKEYLPPAIYLAPLWGTVIIPEKV